MKTIIYKILFFYIFSFGAYTLKAQNIMSLQGKWTFRVDSMDIGEREHWERDTFSDEIELPGSTDEYNVGNEWPLFKSILGARPMEDYPKNADFGMVTRKHKYIGKVWYQKKFVISKKMERRSFSLFLERVMWQSKVWVDGRPVSIPSDYLSTPHIHDLGPLSAGEHWLTVQVDNGMIHPIGTLGHSYCPHMQSQWNGIVGRIELIPTAPISVDCVTLFPSYEKSELAVSCNLNNSRKSGDKVHVQYRVMEKRGKKEIASEDTVYVVGAGTSLFKHIIRFGSPVLPWNEFSPNLYQVEICVTHANGEKTSVLKDFGFRDLGTKDKHFTINGQKILYRNSHEGMFFPQTGYPAMEVSYWKNIWKLYKNHGFNAARFHSSCPPEAAFTAADELGFYLQVEFFWMDGWMGYDNLIGGKNSILNEFVIRELENALKMYSNHPSMMLVSIGNELGGNFEWMGDRISELKKKYPMQLFAAGIAHNITSADDYVEYGGRHEAVKMNGTDWDYTNAYNIRQKHPYDRDFKRKNLPEFTHETGQYIVHPLWSEIKKYKGVFAPKNLEYYRSIAQKNGIASLDKELQRASGQINKNLYKAEIEATLRTPESAGYSLLSMVDYPGQGEALVGWVNPFYENKNFMTPEECAMFGSHTVPLLRFPKYVWEEGELFTGKIEIANYGKESLDSKEVTYRLKDNGKTIDSGTLGFINLPQGELTEVGSFTSILHAGRNGRKLEIEVNIEGTSYKNRWNIWIFPKKVITESYQNIVQTRSLKHAIEELEKGKKVLLLADKLGGKQNRIYSAFNPVFWSATWFTGQDTDVSGAYIRNRHRALSAFPTDDVMDWQWEDICRGSRGFILNEFPADYFPIVQPVNDFHHGNKLGTLFELKTREGGKLMVCGYNLTDSLDTRMATRQLKRSILEYMDSERFNPDQLVEYEWLQRNLKDKLTDHEKEKKNLNACFFIMSNEDSNFLQLSHWNKTDDNIIVNEEDLDYNINCDGVWQDEKGTYWVGKKMVMEIKINHPKLMELKLCFHDSNRSNRTGIIDCEDVPTISLGNHEEEAWVTIPITRENCLDGRIKVIMECKNGPNLMLKKIVLSQL